MSRRITSPARARSRRPGAVPERIVTAASADSRTLDRPRAGPTTQRLVAERVGEAARRDARDVAPEGQQRDVAPSGPGRARVTGPPSGPGAWTRKTREPRVEQDDGRRPASAGWARSHTLARAWSSRGPPNAPRTVIRVAPRASRLEERQLGVRLVLVGRARRIGMPVGLWPRSTSAGASESRSPTRTSGPQAQGPGPDEAAVRRERRPPRPRPSPARRHRARRARGRRRRPRRARGGRRHGACTRGGRVSSGRIVPGHRPASGGRPVV